MSTSSSSSLQVLSALIQYVRPYTKMVSFAGIALVLTAMITLTLGQGVKIIIDNGLIAQSPSQLTEATLIMGGIILLLAIGTFTRFYLVSWLGERVSADIRQHVFDHLLSLHPSYFEDNKSGEIMSRLTTDTTLLQSIIGSSFSMALRSSLTLVGGIVMLLITNIKLTLLVIGVVPLVLVPILLYGRKVRRLSRKSQDSIADVGSYAGEIIQNIKVVQSYTRENQEKQAFGKEVENAFGIAKIRIKQRALLIATVITLVFSSLTLMMWVGGQDVLSGAITGGELAAFVFYAVIVAMAFATISEVYGELQRAAGAMERLLEMLAVRSNVPTGKTTELTIDKVPDVIALKQVKFNYPTRPNAPALDDIDLSILPNKITAIVGPSGAGKTTLFELVQRFYDPQHGQVEFLGRSIKDYDLTTLRQHIGWVPQQPVLFSTNVLHNIRYGRPEASDEEVYNAAKLAHAHDFIMDLPQGYQSELGEQGVRLSGGQKQRIAIARAILKDPQLLLLDEATSALDSESEYHVQAALNELMENRTTLIIAHRLATVMHADQIILMNAGKIESIGTHNQLLQDSALYRRLCELQFSQPEEAHISE